MRKSTALFFALAALCSAMLFRTSQRVNDGREKIAVLESALRREAESQRVLSAEWTYLNQPARLERLARAHLGLVPMKGAQFAKIADLPMREAKAAPVSDVPPEKPAAALKPKTAPERDFRDVVESLKGDGR